MIEYKLSGNIRNNWDGLVKMAKLYEFVMNYGDAPIRIDFEDVAWFGANYAAILGAILDIIPDPINNVTLTNMTNGVSEILSKNGFLKHYGGGTSYDTYSTTIPYVKFDGNAVTDFQKYLKTELMNRSGLPTMSPLLAKKILENIIEMSNPT